MPKLYKLTWRKGKLESTSEIWINVGSTGLILFCREKSWINKRIRDVIDALRHRHPDSLTVESWNAGEHPGG